MAYASTVPDAKDALVTVLSARSGLNGVTVSREYPADPDDIKSGSAYEAIWIGRDGDQNVTGSAVAPHFKASPVQFHETYTLWVTVQCFKADSSGTQEAASERAYTLASEVIGAVASDPTLGLAATAERPLFSVGLDGDAYEFEERTGRLKAGNGCQVCIGLHVTARVALS